MWSLSLNGRQQQSTFLLTASPWRQQVCEAATGGRRLMTGLFVSLSQEPHGSAAHSGLLPAHQQQRPGQHVPHHGAGVQRPPGRGRLPVHDLRLAGDLRTLTTTPDALDFSHG